MPDTTAAVPADPRIAPVAISVPDVMGALKLSRQTVYDEINSGRLVSFRVGNRRLISCRALEQYVSDREAEATTTTRARGDL